MANQDPYQQGNQGGYQQGGYQQDPYQQQGQQGQQQGQYSFGGAKQAANQQIDSAIDQFASKIPGGQQYFQQAKDEASGALDNLEKRPRIALAMRSVAVKAIRETNSNSRFVNFREDGTEWEQLF